MAENANVAGVYRIRNLRNGKCYVGSSRNIGQRWRQHRHTLNAGTSTCRRLQAAWRKYGADAFEFDVLEIVPENERRGAREQEWLNTLGTFERGYNASPTVKVADYMPRPPEWGRKISKGKRGKRITVKNKGPLLAAHRAAISAGMKRHFQAKPNKQRKPLSSEHRRKISDAVRKALSNGRPEFTAQHRARMSESGKRRALAKRQASENAHG